jgi:hypothetical protein
MHTIMYFITFLNKYKKKSFYTKYRQYKFSKLVKVVTRPRRNFQLINDYTFISSLKFLKFCKNILQYNNNKYIFYITKNILIHKCNKQYTNKQFAEIRLVHKY